MAPLLLTLVALLASTATTSAVTGYLRFFGPLSSSCSVMQVPLNATDATGSTVSAGSSVVSSPASSVNMIQPAANCTDLWTGALLPFAIAGDSPAAGSFAINAVTVISVAMEGYQPGAFAYNKLGNTLWNATDEASLVDVISILRAGGSSTYSGVQSTLATDISWIGFNSFVTVAFQSNATYFAASVCNTTQYLLLVLANNVASSSSPVDLTSVDSVTGLVRQLSASCTYPDVNIILATGVVEATVAVSRAISPSGGNIGGLTNSRWPLQDIIFLAKAAKEVSTASAATITGLVGTNSTQIAVMADTQAVGYGAITSVFNQTYATLDLNLFVRATGPVNLAGGLVKVDTVTSRVTNTVANTISQGSLLLPGSVHSIVLIPAGANDYELQDPATPSLVVLTLVGTMAVLPFGAANLTITPMSNIVTAIWMMSQMNVGISVPGEAQYKLAYESIIGGTTTATAYSTRNAGNGSAAMLSMQVAELLVNGVPSLGGVLVGKMTKQDPTVTAFSLYELQVDMTVAPYKPITSTQLASVSAIKTALLSVYNSVPVSRRSLRRSLAATTAQQDAVFNNVAQIMSDANSLVNDILANITAGGDISALFTQLFQLSKLQATSVTSALNAIGSAWASGNFTGAAALATAAGATFTKANQADQANKLVVNPGQDTQAPGSPSASSSSSDSKNKNLAIGLGVGLGVGLALVAVVIIAAIVIHKRRATQNTTPAATAEGAEGFEADQQIAAYYRCNINRVVPV
mmetsp:Transcript_876/g.1301  ORF Transcript_876/g.1301 Transcript_876/m.1301 type:complete len:750 (+) Transcript_876:187-2436(+)|eukprot:CAMPEP_0119103130 /NCGR_PEP_ID=MMETSP1180-20130426/1666_1 /TAXON_ID=3052 ORGANISM="Chlamydomonas cf sp, Strain CCMP681" /NCGR_SAMPLE_ID=MMETSP1180 /ASSEMBLY_ACC=CAM_ASM_000741 /LENGTH=749 /DNA_ID=CAMNT_0007087573 /DNA_START=187 /DNA_END=2436 /DNA_ORIENTATION=-